MVAAGLDNDLARLCGPQGCYYTRYADDITISTARSEMSPRIARYPNALGTGQVILGDELIAVIEKHGFRINHRKSRLQSYWTRQTCTGLVVNGERPSPTRKYIRRLRSLIHHWETHGWKEAAQVLSESENRKLLQSRQSLANHVIGRINYIKMVRGQRDQVAQRLADIVEALPANY